MAKNGVTRGLPRNDATTDQSVVKEAIPRPFMPKLICCAVTNFGNAKKSNEMFDKIVLRLLEEVSSWTCKVQTIFNDTNSPINIRIPAQKHQIIIPVLIAH
ncbi:Uncharacterized protein Fot_22074 [Forsythia ovata]|uniref:Uncharacterized protein n=1 Tax=Forsythia ovata TaxID=205694 RepID=A0ABD1UYI3_9LAMI